MAKDNVLKKLFKTRISSVDATEEQLNFLLEHYLDEDCIIGIHNTRSDYESFFENGLYNQNCLGLDSNDLSNTVMYTDQFSSLMVYPNGDGEKRGKTAIILKIPKKVFTGEQGIFETLQDGKYGIPPQFILGAFQDGKVVLNGSYNKEYKSDNAIKCIDRVVMQDKKRQVEIFKKVYDSKRRRLKDRIRKFIKQITKRKQNKELLPVGDNNVNKGRQELINRISGEVPTLEEQRRNSANFIAEKGTQQGSGYVEK